MMADPLVDSTRAVCPPSLGTDLPSAVSWLDSVVGSYGDALLLVRSDGSVGYANQSACTMLRELGRRQPPVGRHLSAVVGDGTSFAAVRRCLEDRRGQPPYQACWRGPGGERLLVCAVAPLEALGDCGEGAILLGRDLPSPAEHDGQRAKQASLAGLGQLAAGAAHEIRNPLTAVRGFLQLVAAQVEMEPLGHYLQIVRQEIDRIDRITGDLLLLSRCWQQSLRPLSLGDLARRVGALSQLRSGNDGVEIVVTEASGVSPIWCDPDRIEQVLLNLVGNALDAVGGRGQVRLHVRGVPGGFVECRVQDDGPGIPAELLPRLFEPFFTTKANGTGLGLAVSESIVRGCGGHIAVTSEAQGGATFVVRLPVATEADGVPAQMAGDGGPMDGKGAAEAGFTPRPLPLPRAPT